MKKKITIHRFDTMLKFRIWVHLGLAIFICLLPLYYRFNIRPIAVSSIEEIDDEYGSEIATLTLKIADGSNYLFAPFICFAMAMTSVDFYQLLKARRKLNIKETEPIN